MAFQLDTSGFVAVTDPAIAKPPPYLFGWSDLSPFTQGYIEALFRENDTRHARNCDYVSTDGPAPCTCAAGRPPRFANLAPETLARIIADCEARVSLGWLDRPEDGHWFWVSRQNGNLNAHPPLTVQLGDDGKVRFAEGEAA